MNSEGRTSRTAPVIAVLPFQTEGCPKDGKPLARLVGDALIGELSRFGEIEVIAAQSAAAVGHLPESEAARRP